MKKIETLVEDIYDLFDPTKNHEVGEENLEEFFTVLRAVIKRRFQTREEREPRLYMSNLGKPECQLWFDFHPDGTEEKMPPKNYLKFLYGDILEALLFFLAKEAGHVVEKQQERIEVDGVSGKIDGVIDGVLVDAKSASSRAFDKFKSGAFMTDDPFGYVQQLSSYASVIAPEKPAAFFVVDKVDGSLHLAFVPVEEIKKYDPSAKIAELTPVLLSDTPPPRKFKDVPDGKSGNRKLGTNCSYCAHRFRCWPGLKAYSYSSGPRFLTHVEREPKVETMTGKDDFPKHAL